MADGFDPLPIGALNVPVEFDLKPLEKQAEGELKRKVLMVGNQTGGDWARAQVRGYEQAFRADVAKVKEAAARGFLTREEAAKAGRQAGEDYNRAMVAFLSDARRRGLFDGTQIVTNPKSGQFEGITGQALFAEVAESIKNVDDASRTADIGVGRLNQTMASLFRQAAGLHPAMGQVLNVLGSFAIGGALMAGVLAGLSGLALAWDRITASAREAKRQAEESRARLEEIEERRRLGPAGRTPADLQQERQRQARLKYEIREMEQDAAELEERVARGQFTDAEAEAVRARHRMRLEELQKELDKSVALTEAGRAQVEEVNEKADDAERARIQDMEAFREREQERRQRALEAHQREAEQARNRVTQAEGQVTAMLARLTDRASDELLLQIDRIEEEARKAAKDAGVELSVEFLAGLDKLRENARFQDLLQAYQDTFRDLSSAATSPETMEALSAFIGMLEQEAEALEDGSVAQAALNDLIKKANDLRTKGAASIRKTAEERARAEQRLSRQAIQDLRARARLLEENARAALQLANAMGLVSDETARALETIAQLGGAVARILGGDLSAIPSAIGAAAQLVKSIFGKDESEEVRRELIENSRRIRENTKALEDFKERALSNLSGKDREDFISFGGRVLSAMPQIAFGELAKEYGGDKAVEALARHLGVPLDEVITFFEDLEEITGLEFFDAEKGITDLDEYGKAWQAFLDKGLGAFDSTVGGALDALQFKWAILGDAAGTAADRVQEFIDVLLETEGGKTFAEALQAALADGGTEAANALIDEWAARLAAGDETLFGPGGVFQGLTADEVRRLLEDGNGLLEEALNGSSGSTQSFVQARSITEITGSRIEGSLYSLVALQAQNNDLDRIRNALLSALVGGAGVGVSSANAPFAKSSLLAGNGGGGVTVHIDRMIEGGVHITASGGVIDEAQITGLFEREAGRLADTVSRRLGEKRRGMLRSQGRT